ncbi:WD40 repeat domain-containing serine/threonine-protein kinase [Streptosporangium canum]|uniref:WD40 repeat domain-containing serine/threonine-protein kinase n=1 Tax=Streptosporangium canum TaxID=324952 RepID=UPI00339F9402
MSGPHPLVEGDPRQLGDYRLTGVLGEGGQGVVYLGQAPSGQPVAVKTLHARMAADPAARERFLREAEITRRVAAFCTARVIDAGIALGRPYLVSEYVRGPSLDELVTHDGPRTGGGLDRLAITTLTALAAIHRAGIVHRDFKPSNVIMGQEGPVVIDFGIARVLEHSTTRSGLMGTPAYLSPEQLNGHRAGTASDVFAWAATMVYAATGHPAFSGVIPAAVISAIVTREPDLAGVPDQLRPLLTACLAKDPAVRPGVADLFTALTHGAPVTGDSGGKHPGLPVELPHDHDQVSQAGALPGTSEPHTVNPHLSMAAPTAGTPAISPQAPPPPSDSSPLAAPPSSGSFPVATSLPAGSSPRRTRRRLGTALTAAVVVILVPAAFWLKPALTDIFSGTVRPTAGTSSDRQPEPSVTGIPFGTLVGDRLAGPQKWILSLAVGQLDGRPVVVSGGYDGTVRIWDMATGAPLGEPFKGHRGLIESVAVGQLGGRPVAVSGGNDGTVRVWGLGPPYPPPGP